MKLRTSFTSLRQVDNTLYESLGYFLFYKEGCTVPTRLCQSECVRDLFHPNLAQNAAKLKEISKNDFNQKRLK